MKISTSDVQMHAQHSGVQTQSQSTRLEMWVGDRRPANPAPRASDNAQTAPQPPVPSALVRISQAVLQASAQASAQIGAQIGAQMGAQISTQASTGISAVHSEASMGPDEKLPPHLVMMRDLIQQITGVSALPTISIKQVATPAPVAISAPPPAGARNAPNANFGAIYETEHVYEEAEQLHFSAQGVVRTADGQEIRFTLELQMQRQYREQSSTTIRLGNAQQVDPLVINFDGNAAQLQDIRFSFDLDADGQTEEIPLLAGARGYLALDKDGNQRIDNGHELFGPRTGSGFAELASYDDDGNGWIDENDAVFERLQVWTPDAQGQGTLKSLKETGVGAIAVNAISSPFSLRGAGNQSLGSLRASSVYLGEDGKAGTVQHVDLSV